MIRTRTFERSIRQAQVGLWQTIQRHPRCAMVAALDDVEATTAIRRVEVTAAKRMIERTREGCDLYPARLAADSGYGLDRLRCLVGWCTNKASNRTFRSLIGRAERMAHSRARTSRGIDRTTFITALQARRFLPAAPSSTTTSFCTAPANTTASSANSKRGAARKSRHGRFHDRSMNVRDMASDIAKTAEGDHRRGRT